MVTLTIDKTGKHRFIPKVCNRDLKHIKNKIPKIRLPKNNWFIFKLLYNKTQGEVIMNIKY